MNIKIQILNTLKPSYTKGSHNLTRKEVRRYEIFIIIEIICRMRLSFTLTIQKGKVDMIWKKKNLIEMSILARLLFKV